MKNIIIQIIIASFILFVFGALGKRLQDIEHKWSHDHFRIACLEYADEYPEWGMRFVVKQDEEWRFQCVDKTGREWFAWK